MSVKTKIHISHQRILQKLDKSGVKWCLSSYFSVPAKFQLIQSGVFAPIRAHRGGSTALNIHCIFYSQPSGKLWTTTSPFAPRATELYVQLGIPDVWHFYREHISNVCLFSASNWLYFATQKVAGYYVIPFENYECPSIHPSALRFRTLTWVVFDRFSSNFAWTLISGRSGWRLQMG